MAHFRAASFLPALLLPPRSLMWPSATDCLVTAPVQLACLVISDFTSLFVIFLIAFCKHQGQGLNCTLSILPVGMGDSLLFTENPLCANTACLT